MAKKQKEWARRQRNQLHFLLGSKCSDCGAVEDLQLDCIVPQGPEHHRKLGWDCRMRFYWRQYYSGNLALRCKYCNGLKGGGEDKKFFATHTHTVLQE